MTKTIRDFIICVIVWFVWFYLLFTSNAFGDSNSAKYEIVYQLQWCGEHHGKPEVRLTDGSRVDCETITHAVEVDFAPKWYEAVGQSLYYALILNKRAGIVLIIRSDKEEKHYWKLKRVIRQNNLPIDVWTVKNE